MRILQNSSNDIILVLGGDSTIDAAKAANALAANPVDPLSYFEILGSGEILKIRPLPFMAIPTTAGSGSEVTVILPFLFLKNV